MEDLVLILVAAILVEAIVNGLKPLWHKGTDWDINELVAIAVSLVICLGTGLDIFPKIGLPMVLPYLGSILTGVIISRGANVVAKLLLALDELRNNLRNGYG